MSIYESNDSVFNHELSYVNKQSIKISLSFLGNLNKFLTFY